MSRGESNPVLRARSDTNVRHLKYCCSSRAIITIREVSEVRSADACKMSLVSGGLSFDNKEKAER
jgi:hypothetical protein